jgi:hypothetical protein
LFTGDLLEAWQIGQYGLIGHLFCQIFVALDDVIEPVKHGDSLLLYVYRTQREAVVKADCTEGGLRGPHNNPKPPRLLPERLVEYLHKD